MLKNISRSSHWFRRSSSSTNATASYSQAAFTRLSLGHSATNSTPSQQKNHLAPHITGQFNNRNMAGVNTAQTHKHTNRLAKEQSPYLLQHAHNPVDWYPWGEEAIEAAREQDKLIFLSVGYSTCHWCHVMEHETFEDEAVAEIMNKNFINIKVDREERPDIDQIYMNYLLRVSMSGGWPMSVWLTPELTPISAGTYYPPKDRWGMPSFTKVINKLANLWQNQREQLLGIGNKAITAMKSEISEQHSEAVFETGSMHAKLQEALRIFKHRYDDTYGGFGSKPKFPEVPRLKFLLHAFTVTKDKDILEIVLHTLRKIGHGGIRDHVFGGFARYSVDNEWHVPHFEKMLYDQGQLMAVYASAHKLTKEQYFLDCADSIYRYVMKDLRHPQGGFYAGEDADSLPTADATQKIEGAYYAWTFDEIEEVIAANLKQYAGGYDVKKLLQIYTHFYDIHRSGNVSTESDPHGHLLDKNILIMRVSVEESCAKFALEPQELQQILDLTNELLHKQREKRPEPHLDTKIICSWNGLMLSGLAKLANCSNSAKRSEYLETAKQLVHFLKRHLYVPSQKRLLRSCYGIDRKSGELLQLDTVPIHGFLDDYAFVINGLIDYYKASLDISALNWARELQDVQDELFWDSEQGAYFFSQADAANLIVRLKSDHDGAEPCGNSVAAGNLVLLSHYFDMEAQRERVKKLFNYFAAETSFGYKLPEMMCALMLHEIGADLIAIVGAESKETEQFLELCRRHYIPGMIIMRIDPKHPESTCSVYAYEKFKLLQDKTTVYICHNRVCQIPMHEPRKLELYLKENYSYGLKPDEK